MSDFANSPEGNTRPQKKPPKGEAGKGTVILGQSWYHHLKGLEAKRRAEGRLTRD